MSSGRASAIAPGLLGLIWAVAVLGCAMSDLLEVEGDGGAGGNGGADAEGGGDAGDAGAGAGGGALDSGRPDSGGCEPGQYPLGGGCVGPIPSERSARCAFVASLGVACTDADGDCYVEKCEGRLPPGLLGELSDCDDHRDAVHPGAQEDCDEAIDADCDGDPSAGFEIGQACDEGCGQGQVECSVRDPYQTACSTSYGQSDDASAPELCNGVDDDCDGVVDERCRLPLPSASYREPVLCGDDLLLVSDEGLLRITGAFTAAPAAPELLAEGPLRWPACSALGVAWIALGAGDPDCTEAGTERPMRCVGELRFRAAGAAELSSLTQPNHVGPPVLTAGALYWHVAPGAESRDAAATFTRRWVSGAFLGPERVSDEGVAEPAVHGNLLALRAWIWRDMAQTWSLRLRLLDVAAPHARHDFEGPPAPGRPAAGEGWIVWPTLGDASALWALSTSDLEGLRPIQLTATGGPHLDPHVASGRVVWLDAATSPPRLTSLELATGRREVLVRAEIRAGDVTLDGDRLVWIAQAPGETTVHRIQQAPP